MYKKLCFFKLVCDSEAGILYYIIYVYTPHTHVYIYIYLVQCSLPKTHGLNLYAHVLSPLNSGKLRKHVGLETLKKLLI